MQSERDIWGARDREVPRQPKAALAAAAWRHAYRCLRAPRAGGTTPSPCHADLLRNATSCAPNAHMTFSAAEEAGHACESPPPLLRLLRPPSLLSRLRLLLPWLLLFLLLLLLFLQLLLLFLVVYSYFGSNPSLVLARTISVTPRRSYVTVAFLPKIAPPCVLHGSPASVHWSLTSLQGC